MNKVILFDLEQNKPAASLLRELLQHYSTLYLFNCQKQFEYALVDLTELAGFRQAGLWYWKLQKQILKSLNMR